MILRGPRAAVTIDPPVLLAPMEGITDPLFRDLVCPLGGLGGACTEFLRLTTGPFTPRTIRKHLPPPAHRVPVAVQFMAPDGAHLGESAAAAEAAGAAWIDLNFGCPAPVVCGKGAGAALLCDPPRIAAIITAARAGTGLPVSAKIRAGIQDPDGLERLVLTCADAGAAMLTVHARLRVQGYHEPATWAWLVRAKTALDRAGHRIPLVGNGGVDDAGGIARLRAETGCDGVMVGRAALADPWIFRTAAGAPPAGADEARAWLRSYRDALVAARGPGPALPRLKQAVRWWRAGGLFAGNDGAARRADLMRGDLDGLDRFLAGT